MRYVSNDGKFFDTEQECLTHENNEKKRLEEERIQKEKKEREQKAKYDNIKKHYEELMEEIHNYEKDYGSKVFSGFAFDPLTALISDLLR